LTVVIEASLKSGSLITARFALEQGREVAAVPGFPLDPRCQGTNKLIKEGAYLLQSPEEVVELLYQSNHMRLDNNLSDKSEPQFRAFVANITDITDSDRKRVFDSLSTLPINIDVICQELNLQIPVVYSILLELELSGKAARTIGSCYIRLF
jgi:DNA processing protein